LATGNQFRALEPDEVLFLDTVSAAEQKKEQERKAADDEAIDEFKACVLSVPRQHLLGGVLIHDRALTHGTCMSPHFNPFTPLAAPFAPDRPHAVT
jgi:hypothetical protein